MKKLHFILPGGGVKGSFQGGFLYELARNASDLYTISRIDGTSVGALNGYSFSLGQYQTLYDMWYEIKSVHDIFENWTELPYISTLTSGYRLYNNFGLYGHNNLRQKITVAEEIYLKDKDNDTDRKYHLDKFNCVVTAIRAGNYKYVNGEDPNIKDFVLASASPWIVTCPKEIEGELYTDGGLLQTFPLDFIDKTDSDLTIILGYDDINLHTFGGEGNNTLSYLSRLIDIVRLNSVNIDKVKTLIQNQDANLVVIHNPMKLGFLEFNQEMIQNGFHQGREQAKKFITEYLK